MVLIIRDFILSIFRMEEQWYGIIEITCLKKEGDAYDRANLFGY